MTDCGAEAVLHAARPSLSIAAMNTAWMRPALAAAERNDPTLEAEEAAALLVAAQTLARERLDADDHWACMDALLMRPFPSHALMAMRSVGLLRAWLPEVDALFGVPQLCDGPEAIDVGLHQMRLVDETARADEPVAVRFAALMHKIGKGGTLREIWPSHYKHEMRALAQLDALSQRMAVPAHAMELARLVVAECDRVHRASDMRAGALASMLERLEAVERPARFEQLLAVCTCDFAVYPGHWAAEYPKAPRLRRALAAYLEVGEEGLDADALMLQRAQAIARALGSMGGAPA
jgi:tRNA nucleotidyltransferase (CCA-adding enzyme)